MAELKDILLEINRSIDPAALVRLIDYHPDKVQRNDTTLKCFCPVHQERAFRSLIINLKNNSYKCMMKHCPCFEGGSLVDLWSLVRRIEPVEAAIDLAEKLGLSIDVKTLSGLSVAYQQRAREALGRGQLAEARPLVDSALAVDPRNADLWLLHAALLDAEGDHARALAERLRAFDAALETEQHEAAAVILAAARDALGDNEPAELLERALALAVARGDRAAREEGLLRLAARHESRGDPAAAAAVLAQLLEEHPDDPELVGRLATLHFAAGNAPAAAALLDRLATLHEQLDDIDAALEALHRLNGLTHDDPTAGERIALLLQRAGRVDEARVARLELVQSLAGSGDHQRAAEILAALLEESPDDLELLERAAELARHRGDTAEATRCWARAAARAMELDDPARAEAAFRAARALDPANLDLRRTHAEWRLNAGDSEGAVAEMFDIVDACFDAGQPGAGRDLLERLAAQAGLILEPRLRVIRALEMHGLEQEAWDAHAALARAFAEAGRLEAAGTVAAEAARLRPLAPESLELAIEISLAQGRKAEAITRCRQVARAAHAAAKPDLALQALQRGLRLDRCDGGLKADLARLHELQGRTAEAAALWIDIGLVRRAQGETAAAGEAAREALRLDPASREARTLLAEGLAAAGDRRQALDIWKSLAAESAGPGGEGDALRLVLQGLELAPADRELLALAARMTLATEGAPAAREWFERWLAALAIEGDAPAERLALALAVENFPDVTDWRRRLAHSLLAEGLAPEAAAEFERLHEALAGAGAPADERRAVLEQLVDLQPERGDLRHTLARELIAADRPGEAVTILESLAARAVANGDLEDARELLAEAIALDPSRRTLVAQAAALNERLGHAEAALALYERLAALGRSDDEPGANIPVLEKLLLLDPERLDLRAELAALHESEGDLDRAAEHSFRLAQSLARAGRDAEAADAAARASALTPDFIAARELRVDLLARLGDLAGARRELGELYAAARDGGRPAQAEEFCRRILALDPEDAEAAERLAALLEARGDLEGAAAGWRALADLHDRHADLPALLAALRRVIVLHPADLARRRRLARALLAEGRDRAAAAEELLEAFAAALRAGDETTASAALDEGRRAFAGDWAWRARAAALADEHGGPAMGAAAWQALAAEALEAGDPDTAQQAADAALALDPSRPGLRALRVEARVRASRYEAAVEDCDVLAEEAADAGRADEAIAWLDRAHRLLPGDPALLGRLADLHELAGNPAAAAGAVERQVALLIAADPATAESALRRLVALQPADEAPRERLAQFLFAHKRAAEARDIWMALADDAVRAGDLDAAQARCARLLEVFPGAPAILRRLADLVYETGGMIAAMGHYDRLIDALQESGDDDALLAEYERILDLEPGHLLLKERLADTLVGLGRTEEACALLRQTAETWETDREQPTDAVRVWRRLRAIDPADPEARRRLAELHEQLGQGAEAAELWRELAEAVRGEADPEAAAVALERRAALLPDAAEPWIEAARQWEAAGRTGRTIEALLRAIEVHDRHDRLDPCPAILERALALEPDRLDLHDALARVLERLDRLEDAAARWLELGRRREARGESSHAVDLYQHLRRLLPRQLECRRRLAALLEAAGDRPGAIRERRELAALAAGEGLLEEATTHLESLLLVAPEEESALADLAALWRRLGRPGEEADALARLESLHGAAGRLADAVEVLARLRELRPGDPALDLRTLDLLIRTGRLDEAAAHAADKVPALLIRGEEEPALAAVRRLAQAEPAHVERRIALARLLGDGDRPELALREFLLAATALLDMNAAAGALAIMEAAAADFPGEPAPLELRARALARLGRRAEAIEARLHLAALHDAREELDLAQRMYEEVLAEEPENTGTLEAMIAWALRHARRELAADLLLRLGEGHYLAGRTAEAIASLERIRDLEPARWELLARLAELYGEAGRDADAAAAWLAAGEGWIASGRPESAIDPLRRAVAADPAATLARTRLVHACDAAGRLDLYGPEALALAEALAAAGEFDAAIELCQSLTARLPGEPAGWGLLADLCERRGLHADAVDALVRLSGVHQAARRLEPARRCLDRALELEPSDPRLHQLAADCCLALGRRPDGIRHLAAAADALAELGRWDDLREAASRTLKLDPLHHDVRRHLARALEQSGSAHAAAGEYALAAQGLADAGRNDEACGLLEQALVLEPARDDEREQLARLLARIGRVEEAISHCLRLLESLTPQDDPRRTIKYCRQVLALDPDRPEAHRHLALVFERTGKLRQALQSCEWLAAHHQGRAELDQAELWLRKALEWFPEELALRRHLTDLLIETGRTVDAAAELERLAALAETRADASMALWALERATGLDPANLELAARRADALERAGRVDEAVRARVVLTTALLAAGRMEPARLLADRLVEAAPADEALRLEIAALFEEAGLPEVAAYHYHQIARQAFAAGEFEKARELATGALTARQRHVGARETLIEALLALGQNAAALEEYEHLLGIFEEVADWENALRVARALIELAPSRPEPRRRLIELLRRLQRTDEMIEHVRRLIELHVTAGEVERALEALRDLMSERPDDTRARLRYIDLYTQVGDERDLLEDHLQLARIFMRKGAVVEATHAYEKILEYHPDSTIARDELIQFLLEQGQISRAVVETRTLADLLESQAEVADMGRVLERALNYAPDELELRRRLAGVYLRTNRRGLALESFRSLARLHEQAGERDRLVEVVEQIVRIDPLNVEWRQRLIDLAQELGRRDLAVEHLRALAVQYGERGLLDLAEQALRRLLDWDPRDLKVVEDLVRTHLQIGSAAEIIPDLIMLAELYVQQGRLKDAVSAYKHVVEHDGDNIQILNRYVELYIQIGLEQDLVEVYLRLAELHARRSETADAARIYQHLLTITPGDATVSSLLSTLARRGAAGRAPSGTGTAGRVESTAGRDARVLSEITRYEKIVQLNPDNLTARLRLCELLEEQGNPEAADRHWSRAAQDLLARGDLDRCIDICRRQLQHNPDDSLVKERLSKAQVQRDSLKTIDNLIGKSLRDI